MLRRRKDQTLNGEILIHLPKRTVQVISCKFDDSEDYFYNALESKMEGVIEKLMSSGKGNNSYISVLLLLLRLRQGSLLIGIATSCLTNHSPAACNHPILVSADYKKDSDALEPKAVKGKDDQDPDADDDLVAAFGQLAVIKKCQMCTSEYVFSVLPSAGFFSFITVIG
jgi:SNF2 family DNA or RNA helicase